METKINQKIEYFYDDVKKNVIKLAMNGDCDKIIEYFNTLTPLKLCKDDFTKRRRVKNIVPHHDRCCALRANGDQCSRRKKDDSFCGTHTKGQPYGIVSNDMLKTTKVQTKTISVKQQDIRGIIYYIDETCNVYDPSDIINGIRNPRIIAKYTKNNGIFEIPSFD